MSVLGWGSSYSLLSNWVIVQQLAVAMVWATWCNMLRGSCTTDVAMAVAESWATIQEATMSWMKGSRPSISSSEDRCNGSVWYFFWEVLLEEGVLILGSIKCALAPKFCQGSRVIGLGIHQLKFYKKRRILVGSPLKWRGFGPRWSPISCVLLSYCSLWFGSCLMKIPLHIIKW